MTEKSSRVRTYPDLNAACIREKLDLPLRLWYLLRPACDGQGWVSLEDVYRLSCGNRRQPRAWLRQGMDVFWTRDDRRRIWLAGLGTLCKRLGVKPWLGTVGIPVEDIESLEKFRAVLYASWFAFKPKTISRNKLSEIFGRTSPTLRKWEEIAGIKVQRNVAWSELPSDGDYSRFPQGALRALGIKDISEEAKPGGYAWLEYWGQRPGEKQSRSRKSCEVVYGGIPPVICWFLPNTYEATLETKSATTLQRKARKRVKDALTYVPRAKASRLFFEQGQDAGVARSLKRDGVAFVREKRKHHGMNLWSFQHV